MCRGAKTLSEAGRRLFAVSRQDKRNPNDADRLRKYLARFGLTGRRYAPEHHFGISLASFHGLQGRMPMSEIMDVERLRQLRGRRKLQIPVFLGTSPGDG